MAEFVTRSELRNVFDQEIGKLQKKVEELQKKQNEMSRRQTRLRGDVYGTDDSPDMPLPNDEDVEDVYFVPNQPSVMDHLRRIERLTKENKVFIIKELDPEIQALRQLSKENKIRSKKNEKELDRSLEKRAKRFFGFRKKKRSLLEELRF